MKKINEIFYSLQGEGFWTGATFVIRNIIPIPR